MIFDISPWHTVLLCGILKCSNIRFISTMPYLKGSEFLHQDRSKLLIIMIALCLAGLIFVFMIYDDSVTVSLSSSSVRINEVMASNNSSVPDEHGDYPDWIELYNPGHNDANISGFGLTDDMLVAAKWVFPSGTYIEAGGYLVVFLSGDSEKGPLHASFKISANEELVLSNSTGSPVDSLTIPAIDSGATFIRKDFANWETSLSPSPGFANTEEGANQYKESMKLEVVDNGIRINELMASNDSTISLSDGGYHDYIELYNTTESDIDISGFGLTDNLSQAKKWTFPEGTIIGANSYLLVYCTGQDGLIDGLLHAPFGLKAYGESVGFSGTGGIIIDEVTFPTLGSDEAYSREVDGIGEFTADMQPTPGYANGETDLGALSSLHPKPKSDIYISEVMTLNKGSYTERGDITPDWIELYNSSAEPVDISGYGLSDKRNNPALWRFPEGSVINGGEYLLVTCRADLEENSKPNATNFNLSSSGESVFLFDRDGEMLDKLSVPKTKADMSLGRSGTSLYYYEQSTPGSENIGGMSGITTTPTFVTVPGIYDGPMSVELTAKEGETIHYTLDATTPTANSPIYTTPISISQNTVVRAISAKEGYSVGHSNSGTFLFRSDGVNHELKVATLVTDPENLWDGATGIYAFGDSYTGAQSLPLGQVLTSANFYQGKTSEADQENWERGGNLAIFGDDGSEVFSQNINMRIGGGFGRLSAQKGFNLSASNEYGSDVMEYSFFEERDFTEYHSLVLRAGGQDQARSKIRDELAAGLLYDSDVRFLYQAYEPYVLYLNGEYWGVYYLKEKRNRFFVAQHEGMETSENVNLIKSIRDVNYGSSDAWRDVMNFLNSQDMSKQENYDTLTEMVDVYSFMDYIICEIYVANSDYWNIQQYQDEDGKWKWIYYDFCYGFFNTTHNTLTARMWEDQPCSTLFNSLLQNEGWKEEFLHRFAELMNTVFAPENVHPLIDELAGYVEPEIERERAFFNDNTFMGTYQRAEVISRPSVFYSHVDMVRNFTDKRPDIVKRHIQNYFRLSDDYMQEVFG